ncbi:MAG: hypothetical protein IPI38_14870 [Gemmatimonadetes bacterium]|nr:hypothetical protein [Gemmatimonadota bacterium]MBK6780161.1 hypothetical protein [Gemmatimonadota bacterium]MBK7716687.1 hypothetical protein [Gemmatimonadota bacterium]MBK7786062.1 hypothetical protein [Gemmatimonadota bacterium]MBK7922428.1 hypothetical protein [Gemmatimonadota bacterium]
MLLTVPRGALLALALLAGCQDRDAHPGGAPPAGPGTSYTPDSVRQVELRRFREGLDSVAELQGGAPTREALVRAFLDAVAARDSATLASLRLSRAEFAWLYYPTNPQALPPYDLDPATYWLTHHAQDGKGLHNVLERLGGRPLEFVGERCEGEASRQGENRVYGPCLVRLRTGHADTSEGRVFGLVIERRGRWKFVSYANDLD